MPQGYSIKKLVEGMSALLTHILGVGGPNRLRFWGWVGAETPTTNFFNGIALKQFL